MRNNAKLHRRFQIFYHLHGWRVHCNDSKNETLATNQCGKKIKGIRSDNGGEYISKSFKKHLHKQGILHQTSAPHTPEEAQDAYEESTMHAPDADPDEKYWEPAISIGELHHQLGTSGITPEEAWTGKKPSLRHIKILGSKAWALIPGDDRKKLDAKASTSDPAKHQKRTPSTT